MLYYIVKPIIKIALKFFCKNINVNTKQYKNVKGPLLLAVNHPNSFLDAIIIGLQFKAPVYFLARGDAFHKKWVYKILTALKCIPVYRLREGKQYLHRNEDSFERCRQIFKKGGIVLIFTEGLCENEWQVRPLKKGTARLAFSSWQLPEIDDQLQILPVGITYNSFRSLPKKVWLNFGQMINKNEFNHNDAEGNLYQQFNEKINTQWQQLTVDGVANNKIAKRNFINYSTYNNINFSQLNELARAGFFNSTSKTETQKWKFIKSILPFLISVPALIFVFPFYKLIKQLVLAIAGKVVHYDSILFGVCTLFFLFYIPIFTTVCYHLTQQFYLSCVITIGLIISTFVLTKSYITCIRKKRLYKN